MAKITIKKQNNTSNEFAALRVGTYNVYKDGELVLAFQDKASAKRHKKYLEAHYN